MSLGVRSPYSFVMGKDTDELKRPLTRSEKVRNYLIGLGAASALILGLIAQLKGEPVAEKAYEVLRVNQNKQAKELNRIRMRLVYFQAYQEAQTAMTIQSKLEALQKKYDALLAGKPHAAVKPATKPTVVAAPPKKPDCKDGWVRGTDNKCHRVRKAVAVRVKNAAKQAKETKRRLYEEMKRRIVAERKKRELIRKIKAKVAQKSADLPTLPAKLDDATKP